jgi:hypothetical protein
LRFDIHLSASAIEAETIQAIGRLGFVEDEFFECRNCQPALYHATYRGPSDLTDREVWIAAVDIVSEPTGFRGALELEECLAQISTNGANCMGSSAPVPNQLSIQACPPDTYKACDVHIRTMLDEVPDVALSWLDRLGIASFERMRERRPTRVYTATFDQLAAGHLFLKSIDDRLISGINQGISAKLESTIEFVRQPSDAPTLPITFAHQLHQWLDGLDREE